MANVLAPTSLYLGFDETRTKVIVRSIEEYRQEFVQLVSRFRSGCHAGPLTASIDLDDLLAGLGEIGAWPHHAGVEWTEELRELVLGVLRDAESVSNRLASPDQPEEVTPSQIPKVLGDSWVAELGDFQRRDIAKLLSLQHGANFSVPGAGKTRVALAVYAAQKVQGAISRLLVICPKSAYESWQYETGACFDRPLRTNVFGQAHDQWAEVLVVNYERLDRSLGSLAEWLRISPSMLILDEAHRMKLGVRGTYGAACMTLGPLARRRLILTGTPAPNGPKDLEALLGFVWPGHGQRSVTQALAEGDLAHASKALRPLFTRTTKHELGLPPMTPRMRYVEMPKLHAEIYDALLGGVDAAHEDLSSLGRTALRLLMAATSPALLLKGASRYEALAYQLPPLEIPQTDSLFTLMQNLPSYELSPKYQEAVTMVAANAKQDRKTLVWTTFVRSLTTLNQLLKDFSPAIVHGGTRDIERAEQIRRFREDPDCMVLISNPATLGEGISLHQVCHDAIYVDRDFMAGRFLQSLDRIHRLGLDPDAATTVTVLGVRNTIDEVVEARLRVKLEFMGKILDDSTLQQLADLQEEPSVAAGLASSDISALLRHIRTR